MPSTSTLIAFVPASFVLVVVTGPSVLFIVGRAQCRGLAASAARNWFATSPARLSRVGGAGGLVLRRVR